MHKKFTFADKKNQRRGIRPRIAGETLLLFWTTLSTAEVSLHTTDERSTQGYPLL